MKITIGYLYNDLLNLYGDSGNIKALIYHLEEQDVKVEIKYFNLNEDKDFSDIDFLYIGSGTEDNINLALKDLEKDKDKLKKYIKNKKIFLATGNSVELFGNYIIKNDKVKTLGIFDYVCMWQKRIVKDVKIKSNIVDNYIIGFENHNGKILSYDEPIIKIDNFYGTYILGPILARNYQLCEYFVKEIIKSKDKNFKFKKGNYDLEIKSYKKTVDTII